MSTGRTTDGPTSAADAYVEQPAVVRQECTVTDDVPSRAEDCTFPVEFYHDQAIVIVLHSITVVCPRLLTVGDSVVCVCFSF